jgi:hypothetical protein
MLQLGLGGQMFRFGSPIRLSVISRCLAMAITAVLAVSGPAAAQTFNTVINTWTGDPSNNVANQAAVADFDSDGKVDAVITHGSSELRLLLGNGNGSFNASVISVSGGAAGAIRTADLNADGTPDIVFGNGQGNLAPAVLLNTGNVGGVPQFTLTNYTPIYNGTRSITVGDLNGDGKPDFLAGSSHGYVRALLNNGDGTFVELPLFSIAAGEPSTGPGVIADLNGDGKADFVVTANQVSSTVIFLGNGDGTFGTRTVLTNNATQIAAADVNGDGTVDLLEGNVGAGGNELLVYLNDGAGNFTGPTTYSTGGTAWHGQYISLSTTDVNGDGKVDVSVTNSNQHNVVVFVNDGGGSFTASATIPTNVHPVHLTVGDFTGDDKLDIATVGADGNLYGVLTNTTVFVPPTVFASGTANVTTWDPIFPGSAYSPWQSQCSAAPTVGPDANWLNPQAAFSFPLGSHPWEDDPPFDFAANWINAWSDLASRGPIGPGGRQNWTKYSTEVTGEGDFVVQFLADNCSWIYLDDQLIGVQDNNWSINGTGRYPLTLTGSGPHTLSFIIWDGGGSAGGKFRLETRQSFIDGGGDPDDLPTKAPTTTTVSFGDGPFTYTGTPFIAIASVTPGGDAAVTYSGDCTNAGNTCTATATYDGDATHFGSTATASITIVPVQTATTVTFGGSQFVYTGSALGAMASAGATIEYSGSCTNVGTCTATATTAGDANHIGSTAVAAADITKASTATTISFDDGPFVYKGSPFIATASTSPVGTPTVVYTGDCTNAGNTCKATATYAGDANYARSSSSASITIEKRPTVTTVTFGAGPFVYKGSAFTATATVSPYGTATIVYSGNCVIPGTTCSATATYPGDGNQLASSGTATAVITIWPSCLASTKKGHPACEEPKTNKDNYSMKQDTVLSISAKSGVRRNDGNTPATIELVSATSHGTLTLSANGAFVYTPAPGFVGTDSFRYIARSVQGIASDVELVTIQVTKKRGDDDDCSYSGHDRDHARDHDWSHKSKKYQGSKTHDHDDDDNDRGRDRR